jgi:phosphoglycerol transferase MdoB-like AlkP superfamily enzyme
MYIRLDRAHRFLPAILGVAALAGVGALVAWDAVPRLFPAGAHDVLAAFPLATIALAYLVYQAAHRPARMEVVKAILLAVAFLFWAANQLWPGLRQATLFNDIAIALFVLDVFLVMAGWPRTSPDESFAETYAASPPDTTMKARCNEYQPSSLDQPPPQ